MKSKVHEITGLYAGTLPSAANGIQPPPRPPLSMQATCTLSPRKRPDAHPFQQQKKIQGETGAPRPASAPPGAHTHHAAKRAAAPWIAS